jgi:anaerobic magnesium-protoporphyrin IX monomethyl ester cyclase
MYYKMKILLINPITRPAKLSPDREGVGYPMGIGYIGAFLQNKGHQVTCLDNNQKCLDKDGLRNFFRDKNFDIVGISSMANTYNQVLQLSKFIKEEVGCPIVMGGALPTYSAEVVLRNMAVDVCVLGEGEETSEELFGSWPNYQNVDGIAYLNKKNEYIETKMRIPKLSRDDYPYPGYDGLIDITKYYRGTMQTWETHIKDEKLNKFYFEKLSKIKIGTMVSGMGCPYKCTFCTNSTPFMKTRERSPENVAKEAKYLKENFGIKGIRFDDDLLILQKERSMKLAEELSKAGVYWSGQAVGRSTTDEELVKKLSESGCVGYGIGVESGSDRLLKSMMKGSRTIHYQQSFDLARKYNMGVRIQVLYGMPGEDRSTLQETIDFFKKTKMPPRRFNKLFPMPGSQVYDKCVENGIITDEHTFLNISSMVSGYTSKSFKFNVTNMSDKEFDDNLAWAEKTMYKNYEKLVYRDPLFWFYKIKHYIKKILEFTPIVRRVKRAPQMLKNILIEKNIGPSNEMTMNEVTTLYPELLPDKEAHGFINKPLNDERVEKIMAEDTVVRKPTNSNKFPFLKKTSSSGNRVIINQSS